ncbi:unnamed protein product, partial [Ascophyllum nodosum]
AVNGPNGAISLRKQTFNRILFYFCNRQYLGVQKAKNEDRETIGCSVAFTLPTNSHLLPSCTFLFSHSQRDIVVYLSLLYCISLTADGPQRARLSIPPTVTLPSCLWSRRIFPSLPCSFSLRCKFSSLTTRQLMVEFYITTRYLKNCVT